MSGILVRELVRRARSYLRSARLRIEWGDYDLACLDVEQALQLYLKAVLIELFGIETRVHGVLEHLAILRRELANAGFSELASMLSDVTRENRDIIDLLDDSYIGARYTVDINYTVEHARRALDFAEKLIKILDEITFKVKEV